MKKLLLAFSAITLMSTSAFALDLTQENSTVETEITVDGTLDVENQLSFDALSNAVQGNVGGNSINALDGAASFGGVVPTSIGQENDLEDTTTDVTGTITAGGFQVATDVTNVVGTGVAINGITIDTNAGAAGDNFAANADAVGDAIAVATGAAPVTP